MRQTIERFMKVYKKCCDTINNDATNQTIPIMNKTLLVAL